MVKVFLMVINGGSILTIFNPLTPRSNFNSSHCQPYNFYNIGSENLVLDQLIIPKLVFFFIFISYLVDIVLIL